MARVIKKYIDIDNFNLNCIIEYPIIKTRY